ncbi:hypothetical protein JB92DRAFT_2825501 [Gautieria morchelliformis]|nr:hypothetical protein JB92DRAFT_2825501 [Gautieria morchelliformis]
MAMAMAVLEIAQAMVMAMALAAASMPRFAMRYPTERACTTAARSQSLDYLPCNSLSSRECDARPWVALGEACHQSLVNAWPYPSKCGSKRGLEVSILARRMSFITGTNHSAVPLGQLLLHTLQHEEGSQTGVPLNGFFILAIKPYLGDPRWAQFSMGNIKDEAGLLAEGLIFHGSSSSAIVTIAARVVAYPPDTALPANGVATVRSEATPPGALLWDVVVPRTCGSGHASRIKSRKRAQACSLRPAFGSAPLERTPRSCIEVDQSDSPLLSWYQTMGATSESRTATGFGDAAHLTQGLHGIPNVHEDLVGMDEVERTVREIKPIHIANNKFNVCEPTQGGRAA